MFEKNKMIKAASEYSGLISWHLEIQEKAPARLRQGTLFQESSDNLSHLQQLENMIHQPLEFFILKDDWLASDSFIKSPLKAGKEVFDQTEDYLPLGRTRPLFLYRDIETFSRQSLNSTCFGDFQERTMDKWWHRPCRNISREYYQVLHEQTLLWIYRDQSGSWHTHGVYG